ncbi:hypothetical protein [Synechococcus sp. UW140]|uniref:hypothetical protein n=1 Tax=Synechococcus sp. UW140 TaxID=368503 RepID=UPI003137D441
MGKIEKNTQNAPLCAAFTRVGQRPTCAALVKCKPELAAWCVIRYYPAAIKPLAINPLPAAAYCTGSTKVDSAYGH